MRKWREREWKGDGGVMGEWWKTGLGSDVGAVVEGLGEWWGSCERGGGGVVRKWREREWESDGGVMGE